MKKCKIKKKRKQIFSENKCGILRQLNIFVRVSQLKYITTSCPDLKFIKNLTDFIGTLWAKSV